MTTERDEAIYWAAKSRDAQHDVLDSMQAAAGKWQAAIAAFLGAYATVGFVLGPDKVAALALSGPVEAVVLSLYVLSGVLGVVAVIQANLASQGIPEVLSGVPLSGQLLARLTLERAIRAKSLLRNAIGLAALAGFLAIATSLFVLALTTIQARHKSGVVSTPSGFYCGRMVETAGRLAVQLPTGTVVPTPPDSLTVVTACPR